MQKVKSTREEGRGFVVVLGGPAGVRGRRRWRVKPVAEATVSVEPARGGESFLVGAADLVAWAARFGQPYNLGKKKGTEA